MKLQSLYVCLVSRSQSDMAGFNQYWCKIVWRGVEYELAVYIRFIGPGVSDGHMILRGRSLTSQLLYTVTAEVARSNETLIQFGGTGSLLIRGQSSTTFIGEQLVGEIDGALGLVSAEEAGRHLAAGTSAKKVAKKKAAKKKGLSKAAAKKK